MPSPKLYSPADIMKALPVVLTLWYKPFKELKQMYRAKGGPQLGRHINKRECIMFLAFGASDATNTPIAPDPQESFIEQIKGIERRLIEIDNQRRNEKARADANERIANTMRDERNRAQENNAQLIGTLRQLMHS